MDTAGAEEAWDEAAPRPEALVQSLRSFGYSPETAVADLLDNSISAGATSTDLHFVWEGAESHVAIVDDGKGMDERTLVEAMRPGAISPLQVRAPKDLGRFGLGLKTASFSQARELTVITSPARGVTFTRRWDLDLVGSTGEWRLLRSPSAQALPYLERLKRDGGTAVVWTKCDRLVGDVAQDAGKAHDRFLQTAGLISKHLGMTFHRFLGRRGGLTIRVNGHTVAPWDPILKHSATHQVSPPELLPFAGSTVKVASFVLPHRSKLDSDQQLLGGGVRGWNAHQGFYVYRNDRLVVAGDWLGLGIAKDEHTKLARILIDFNSELDLAWQIDVKKSTARPPGTIIADLKRIAAATRRHAEAVYRHRGAVTPKQGSPGLVFAWQEYKERSGSLRLRLNRKHPIVRQALDGPAQQRKAVERILRFAEETVPTTLIGVRLSESLDHQNIPFGENLTELNALLGYSFEVMTKSGLASEEAIRELSTVEPFSSYPHVLQAFKEQRL